MILSSTCQSRQNDRSGPTRRSPKAVASYTTPRDRIFGPAKRKLDEICGVAGWRVHDLRRTIVSGMARLGVPPHIADKILNHQSGTISGVAAVYQRHEFLAERKDALDQWGAHVTQIVEAFKAKAA